LVQGLSDCLKGGRAAAADRAAIRKRLRFAGVTIMTPADGVVTDLTDGIRAVIDSQYLDDLKHATRRGMAGVIRDKRHAGGKAYGYTPVKASLAGSSSSSARLRQSEAYLRNLWEAARRARSPVD
jgi:site-specific DNA recombinase